MAWQETLSKLKEELVEVRAERQRQAVEDEAELGRQRDDLSQLAGSLGISELLADMNKILLDGKGNIDNLVSWDPSDDEDNDFALDEDDEEEEADVIDAILSWEEDGQREIAVELGVTDEGTYLRINGVDIRPDRDAVEQALLQAFQDELAS